MWARFESSNRSSASIQSTQSPLAWSRPMLRASAKLSSHGWCNRRAPQRSAISPDESRDPVSTTMISSATRPMDVRHSSRTASSSRTMRAAVSNGFTAAV